MTDDGHLVFAELVFTGQEGPAQLRFRAKYLEVAGRNETASQLDGFRSAGQRDGITGLCGHEVEDGVVALPVEKFNVEIPLRSPRGGFSMTRTMRSASG